MTGVGAWQKIKVPSLWFLPSIWEELSQVLKSGNVNFITFLKATIAEGKISWCCIFIWGKIIKVNFWNKHSKKSSWFFGEMNGVRRKCMTVCTGRARGVIQEVATDKIHQIAGEEQGGGREGTLEFTGASLVYCQPGLDYCRLLLTMKPPIISSKLRLDDKKQDIWRKCCNGFWTADGQNTRPGLRKWGKDILGSTRF